MLRKVAPENIEVANLYLETQSIERTAALLHMTPEEVSRKLEAPDSRRYLDQIYLDTGYRNRFKIAEVLDKLIDIKIQEGEETGFYTKADLLDLLKFANELTKKPGNTNIQVNNDFGGNYTALLNQLK